jgi:hypothetical protein
MAAADSQNKVEYAGVAAHFSAATPAYSFKNGLMRGARIKLGRGDRW